MGSLAFWGGVSGLGQGITARAIDQGKEEDQARDEAKQARLKLLEHQYRGQEQEQATQGQMQVEGVRGGIELAGRAMTETGEDKRAAGVQTGENTRAAERLKSEEKVASTHEKGAAERSRTSAQARVDAAAISARARVTASTNSKAGPRWSYQKINLQGTYSNGVLVPGAQVPLLTDNQEHHQYVQVGEDKFLPWTAGDPVPTTGHIRRAASSEVDALLKNPGQVDNFLKTYGYIPRAWIERATSAGQQGSASSSVSAAGPAYNFDFGKPDTADNGSQDEGGDDEE